MDPRVAGGWWPRATTRSASRQTGMVSAETAVAVPALVAVTLMLVWVLSLAICQGQTIQAAREGVRAAARGESTAQVIAVARSLAPGASVRVVRGSGLVTVTASVRRSPALPLLRRWGQDLSATATTAEEVP